MLNMYGKDDSASKNDSYECIQLINELVALGNCKTLEQSDKKKQYLARLKDIYPKTALNQMIHVDANSQSEISIYDYVKLHIVNKNQAIKSKLDNILKSHIEKFFILIDEYHNLIANGSSELNKTQRQFEQEILENYKNIYCKFEGSTIFADFHINMVTFFYASFYHQKLYASIYLLKIMGENKINLELVKNSYNNLFTLAYSFNKAKPEQLGELFKLLVNLGYRADLANGEVHDISAIDFMREKNPDLANKLEAMQKEYDAKASRAGERMRI